jgi:hypothetical protein
MTTKKTHLPGVSTITILNDTDLPGQYLLFVDGEIVSGSNRLTLILEEANKRIRTMIGNAIRVKVDIVVELF